MASQRVCGISKIEKNRYRSRCCLRVTKTTSDTSVDSERRLDGAERSPPPSLCFSDSGSAFCCPGAGRQPAVESAAPLSRHDPHDARVNVSSILPNIDSSRFVKPVTLPPGRARLCTQPTPTALTPAPPSTGEGQSGGSGRWAGFLGSPWGT